MSDGNHKFKTSAVVITVMGTLIALGVVGIFGMSTLTSREQGAHAADAAAHPVIQQNVERIADDVEKIGNHLEQMMLRQERQTVLLEEVRDDVAEVKEAQP